MSGAGSTRGKFYDWRKRYGKVNEHNGLVPRDHWIEDWEAPARDRLLRAWPTAISLDGYRRLTFMMLDEDVVALSPSTTYRVLSKAGRRWRSRPASRVSFLEAKQDVLFMGSVGVGKTFLASALHACRAGWNGKPSKKGTGFVQPTCDERTNTGIRISRT